MKRPHRHRRHPSGAIALLTIVTISAFTLAIVTAVSVISTSLISSATTHRVTEQVFYAAESGLHDALYRLGSDAPSVTTYSIVVNGVDVTISMTASGFNRTITAVAHAPVSNITRTVVVDAVASSFGGGFNGAVQSGAGGLLIDNGGKVYGDMHIGDSSGSGVITSQNNAKIFGNIWVTGASGIADNVTLPSIDDRNGQAVAYNLRANTIKNSSVSGDAYYTNLQGSIAVHGSPCNSDNSYCHPGSTDPLPIDFPLTVANIQTLATQIQSTGNTISTCDGSGNYTITNTNPLPVAPTKITCNLVFDTNNVSTPMTLSSNLWVTGNITFTNNNQTLWLPTTSTGQSAFILSGDPFIPAPAGTLTISNNVVVQGSDHTNPTAPKDFIFFISMSTRNTVTIPAITGSNNSSAAVYYAPNGLIDVSNGAVLNNTTAKTIHIGNATVNYTSGLQKFFFNPITRNVLTVNPATWREL